jgi:hypothetical protein
LIPLVAAAIGLFNGFRMMRLPPVAASTDRPGMDFG